MSLRPPIKRRLTVYAAPGPSPHNVRSPAFFVARGHCRCWKCNHSVEVTVVGVGPPFSRLIDNEWRPGPSLAILSYVESVPLEISGELARLAPHYFRDESQWHRLPYWMNHCDNCGAKVGDYEVFDSPDAPFKLRDIDVHRLSMTVVSAAFEAAGVVNILGFKA